MNNEKIRTSYTKERQVLGEVLPIRVPLSLVIDVSEVCNFKCNYCFRSNPNKNLWGYARKNNLMEWSTFEKVIDQVLEFKGEIKSISLSSHGEPLCNRKLPKMIKYIKEKGIKSRVSIHTNASLLDNKYIEELAASNIDKIVVSLQGLNEEKYKKVCNYDINYEEFKKMLKLLYEKKQNTELFIKITDASLEEKEKEKFYKEFSNIADGVFIEKIVPIWKGIKNFDLQLKNDFFINKYGQRIKKQKCCPLIFYTLVVTPNGDVYPCTQLLSTNLLGNINEHTLLEFWNSNERKKLLRDQLTFKTDNSCIGCGIIQNSIFEKTDMIDEYRYEILNRIDNSDNK